jgi:hypothetical protein
MESAVPLEEVKECGWGVDLEMFFPIKSSYSPWSIRSKSPSAFCCAANEGKTTTNKQPGEPAAVQPAHANSRLVRLPDVVGSRQTTRQLETASAGSGPCRAPLGTKAALSFVILPA